MILRDKHPLLTNIPEVNQICKPLEKLGITYFHAARKYKDGSCYCLSSGNVPWHKYVFDMERPASTNLHSLPSGNYLWSEIYPEEMNAIAHNELNIAHAFSILENCGDYYDLYAFATTPQNHGFTTFCRNNIDFFESFIEYFNQVNTDLTKIAKKSPIILPPSMLEEEYLEPIRTALKETPLEKAHQSLKLSRYTIGISYITYREAEILYLSAKGKTNKEIASILGIKTRTVESHFEHMRKRLCTNKSELIKLFFDNGIDKFFR